MASGVNFELRTSHFPESYGGIKLCAAFFTAVEMKLPPRDYLPSEALIISYVSAQPDMFGITN